MKFNLRLGYVVVQGEDVSRTFQEVGAAFPESFIMDLGKSQRDAITNQGQEPFLMFDNTVEPH